MYKSEVNSEKFDKNNILYRSTLRGLKKCTACGFINAQRALVCRNVNCDLRIKRLATIKPFDPKQLITYNETKIFSLRTKEKLLNPRNFVSITESTKGPNATIVSRKAVCYVDTCKYDEYDSTHICCKHIKACAMLTTLPLAEVYPIDKGILWNLNIPDNQKFQLWDLYQMEEKRIHPIQKLNASTFVVKCLSSKMFPAGRLHVTVFGNTLPNKNGYFSCSCKKLKIVLEPDNSVTMKKEVCDHLLLLLAAILNKPEGKLLYGKFLDSLQYLWMPTSLNTPVLDCCNTRQSQLMEFGLNMEKCKTNVKEIADSTDDIFNFSEELFAENNIPDFSDIILDVKNEYASTIPTASKSTIESSNLEMHIKDPKLNATTAILNDDDLDLNFPNINPPETLSTSSAQIANDFNENSLSVIEQFQLNHNIQVSNDNIALAKDIENLNNLESQVFETSPLNSSKIKQKSLLKTTSITSSDNDTATMEPKTCLDIKPAISTQTISASKSIIFKQSPVKIIKIAKPVGIIQRLPSVNNKIIQISKINPNKIILIKPNHSEQTSTQITNNLNKTSASTSNTIKENCSTPPSISYESWLDHLIEVLNDSITITDSTNIKHTFHVHDTIFSYFSKNFSINDKRRLPNVTTLIKSGKYKDHIKYAWHFNQTSTVQRIFATNNTKIELERSFERLKDGNFELYTPKSTKIIANINYRPILTKLHTVFVQFTNTPDNSRNNLQTNKSGLKIEWLPSAFPKSNYGLMTIEFCVSFKEPES